VGESGTILRTTNGGATWSAQSSGTPNFLSSVFFTDANTGTAVGQGGTILRTTTGGVVWVQDENQSEIPNNFTLLQNYPNPFNPSTKIRFAIPFVGTGLALSVQLKVYDILGNEVATLVNEEKAPGTYEVEFNATQLSSGIYFYKLQAGNFMEAKKMVLVK
jgi:hypothetical protein